MGIENNRKMKIKKRRGRMTFEFFNNETGYVLKKRVTPEARAKITARMGRITLKFT